MVARRLVPGLGAAVDSIVCGRFNPYDYGTYQNIS